MAQAGELVPAPRPSSRDWPGAMGRGPRRPKGAAGAAAVPAAETAEPSAATKDVDPSAANGLSRQTKRPKRQKLEEADEGPIDPAKAGKRIAEWVEDSEKQERWLASRGGGLEGYLTDSPGCMVRLRDFLPLEIADCVLAVLESLPEETWELSERAGDDAAASHRFWSADVCDVPALAPLRGLFWSLLPQLRGKPTLPIFSCGRYGKSDFIGRHDDRAHVPFDGPGNVYSRTAAAIWYLTRDWAALDGGCLLDLHEEDSGKPKATHVPVYNALMVFEVPHWHAVTAVTSERYRYSIFGWWHQPGKHYELPGVALSSSIATTGAGTRPRKKRKMAHGRKERREDDQGV
uniref:Fe2OG dioxygenase domain-containing protein n=1 Tax=Alexandrium monilatum TaxID=311494 RepID=A0A7S4SU13_9DINO